MKKNETSSNDWHRADIKAALEKKGLSMTKLSLAAGLSEGTLRNVFRVNYPKAQKIIADAIGISPESIWPSRY